MRGLTRWIAVSSFGFCLAAGVQAASPPVTLDQQQFDAVVASVSQAVARKLKDEGVVAISRPAGGAPVGNAGDLAEVGQEAAAFVERSRAVLSTYPVLWASLAHIPAALDQSRVGGWRFPTFAAMLGAAIVAASAAETGLRLLSMPVRRRLLVRTVGTAGVRHVTILALVDALALLGAGLVSYGATATLFAGSEPQSRLATAALLGFFTWRSYLFAFRIVLRPDAAAARLAHMPDEGAAALYRRLAIAILAAVAARTTVRFLVASGTPADAVGALILLNDILLLAIFVWVAGTSRSGVAQWFGDLIAPEEGSCARSGAARHWLHIALPFFVALAAANAYGAISGRPAVPSAMAMTLNVVLGLLLFETLLRFLRRTRQRDAAPVGAGKRPLIHDLVARCVRMAVLVASVVVVAQAWIVDVFDLVPPNQWHALAGSGFRAGGTVFVAYVAWQVIEFFAARYALPPLSESPAAGEGNDTAEVHPRSARLATLVPLVRFFFIGTIGVVALLVVLSEAGVNITPLLAGASVFGLAISFGSQTLVKDIVSGVFYLADDAFRVGEYIDCGKAKGSVEGFTIRSIRLRHQNGPVHTIPFGQLGQITNFSRGWSVVKFNLSFAPATDVEKLRKLVKRIGGEMAGDPNLKDELIEPLKMMGVVEIADNALVIRFKFTVRPGNPGMVQRDALTRMLRAFPEAGIQFSNGATAAQPATIPVDPGLAALSAASPTAPVPVRAA